jgi:outer membrane protein insertion porin family
VIVLPFEMHSLEDLSGMRRYIMEAVAGGLHSEGAEVTGTEVVKRLVLDEGVRKFTEDTALKVSGEADADFAVLGSIARLGKTTTVDMRVLDLKTGENVAFFTFSSVSEADLLRKLKASARRVYSKMGSAIKARPAVRSGILDVVTVTGNVRVDTEAVMRKVTSRPGEPFSPDDVREDIRAIYSTGYFDDVSADLADTSSGKILTYIVKELPYVKRIELKGNDEIKADKINTLLTIKENTVLDRVILGENAENIKRMYADEGFYLAEVNTVVETDGLDATVIFDIEEGPEVRVKRVTIIGNEAFSGSDIKGLMNTKEAWLFSVFTQSGRFNEFMFNNDLAMILGHYYDNGYIESDILDHRVLLSEDKKWFYITIALSEGEQFRIGEIDVTGDILTTKRDILEKTKLTGGEVFSRTRLAKDMDAINDIYGDKGYAYAEIKPLTRMDPENKIIDLTFEITKNEPVTIERIDITGNSRTRDKVIRRELENEEGELYSSSKLKRSRNNLRRLGYFEDVRIKKGRGSDEEKIRLDVDVKERPTGSISIGMGYSSVDKLIGTASISQSNFMGTGVKLNLSGTVSSSSSRYVIGLTEPWLFDKPISAGFDLYNTEREFPDFKIRKNGGGLRFGFPIYERSTRGYLSYKLEDVHIFDIDDAASSFIKEQAGTNTESSLTATVKRDTRDDAFFPTEGSVLTLSTEFAGGFLGGTSYFVKGSADAVKFFSLPLDTTFSIHGSVGHVQGYSGRTAPIYEKFFLGGINTLRGFETRTVSPKDPDTGDLIGGNTMMVLNLEFLFTISKGQNLKGVIFFDAGNSYQGRVDFDDIRTSAGAGFRWFSPMGPLRLELGFNLDRRDDEPASQWDFTIGTLF